MLIQEIPKISIVTPSYNQANFLEATIQSVLSQNYRNLEYIIIDGGSTDGSLEIIKKYEKYLHFWCSEPDKGQYDAINKGFKHSTGEIMAWINSDDMYCPWVFKTVADVISELPEVEWLTTLRMGLWDWHGFCIGFFPLPGYAKAAFLDGYYLPKKRNIGVWIQQESTFWRRSLWEKAGSFICQDFKLAGDFELWSRFFIHTELYGVDSPLAGFRVQSKQKSRQIDAYFHEAEQILSSTRESLTYSNVSWLKNICLQLSLHRIPKVEKAVASLVGYDGKKIVRRNQDTASGFWQIQEYKFL
ncbi:glycosyltransferase family 2 protein [Calothrix sp. PCC 6303]|uniref:glycosyltransferase family 2 protein n=1 Tax=Calothrix sp. PCC 6303 TaxID=1170562 RepID=UPI0002A026C6|nr:glycosyltransferase family 2 protein [Calothrix sp. PCC 6303]AFZ02044.1 glycosyl transferase family 2 [Calothrix sp. PCC 6303]